MKNILKEFRYPPLYASTLFINNKSGIKIIKNLEYYRYMKHLDLYYCWLRNVIQNLVITLVYISFSQNIVNIFTIIY